MDDKLYKKEGKVDNKLYTLDKEIKEEVLKKYKHLRGREIGIVDLTIKKTNDWWIKKIKDLGEIDYGECEVVVEKGDIVIVKMYWDKLKQEVKKKYG